MIGSVVAIILPPQTLNPDAVGRLLDKTIEQEDLAAGMAVTDYEGKGTVLVRCSESAVKNGLKAGQIVKAVAEAMDGRGGGKPTFARGGVDASKYDEGKAAFLKALEK
jgi:alanyl-tRNA synthetase